MEQKEFEKVMANVIDSMKSAGYDPLTQLTGYLQTNNDTFITRTGDARNIVRSLNREQIAEYIEKSLKT